MNRNISGNFSKGNLLISMNSCTMNFTYMDMNIIMNMIFEAALGFIHFYLLNFFILFYFVFSERLKGPKCLLTCSW